MKKKVIYVSVSNDISNDNRVLKTSYSLEKFGYKVVIVGKKTKNSPKFTEKIKAKRLKVLFKKNVFYYAELNIKLFFYLLFHKQDVLWANDLDTLLPNFLVSKLKNKQLIFDSHEMFPYVAELKIGSFQQRFWLNLERFLVPKVRNIVTVCGSLGEYFEQNYGKKAVIVRNIPPFDIKNQRPKQFPLDEKYIIWQGSVNINRGLEELVEAMKDVNCKLFIFGYGKIYSKLQAIIIDKRLEKKVFLVNRLPFSQMMELTRRATLGICIDKPVNQNYKISLPNKIFEYINAATPVLYSPLREISHIENEFNTGISLQNWQIDTISSQINSIINDNDLLKRLSDNCIEAQKHLSWQNEEQKLSILMTNLR